VDIRLSNLQKLAGMPMPAFIVLVLLDDEGLAVGGRALHIDRDWIARISKRVVDLPLEERGQVHEKTMRWSWGAEGELLAGPNFGKSLLTFMAGVAGTDAREYALMKHGWHEEVGYDGRPYRVSVSLPAMAADVANETLAQFAVGLRKTLDLADLTIFERRFGQEEAVRTSEDASAITFQFTDEPPGEKVSITVRSSDGQEEATLPMTMRAASGVFGFLPDEHDIWRFSGTHLDIVATSPRGTTAPRFDLSLPVFDGGQLSELAAAVRAFRILMGRMGSEFIARLGDREFAMPVPPQTAAAPARGARYRQAIEDADRMLRIFGIENVRITDPEALDAEAGRLRLMAVLQAPLSDELTMGIKVLGEGSAPTWDRETSDDLTIVNFAYATIEGATLCQVYAVRGRPAYQQEGNDIRVAIRAHVVEQLGRKIIRDDAAPEAALYEFAAREAQRLRQKRPLVIEPGPKA
jgi:hypothetical protein